MATTFTIKRKLFADAAQIADIEKRIADAKKLGKDASGLERTLARLQGEAGKLSTSSGIAVQAGTGSTATTVMSKGATEQAVQSAAKKATTGSNFKGVGQSIMKTWKGMGTGGKIGVGALGATLVAAPIVAGVAGKKRGQKKAVAAQRSTLY